MQKYVKEKYKVKLRVKRKKKIPQIKWGINK